jgi:hypothetical protein
MAKLVTILIPNYKTPELTKLCMRLLKKNTNLNVADVIVIDNDSKDASLDYLRTLPWIKLIERQVPEGEPGYVSHALALDQALKEVKTPYVLSIHTDTLMTSSYWLPFLLKQMEKGPTIAAVGSWKLETKAWYQRLFKSIEYYWQSFYFKLIGKEDHCLLGQGNNYYYLRSHCALYRMDLIKKYNLSFLDGDNPAGKLMHKKLVDAGYKMIFLPSETLGQYMDHLNHATMILNPELGARQSTITKGLKRMKKRLAEMNATAVLADESLDR